MIANLYPDRAAKVRVLVAVTTARDRPSIYSSFTGVRQLKPEQRLTLTS